jgi:hypothetical protein
MQAIDIAMARADVRWGAALALLQAGFSLPAREGMSARDFMREALGFPDDYIEGVVSTVFLDDSPVDDIDAARIVEGSRIALSAAMPGLVGAVMRRHSPYAALRETISYRSDVGSEWSAGGLSEGGTEGRSAAIRVGVKLFNSVMRDRGPEVLARGIFLQGERAAETLRLFEAVVIVGGTHSGRGNSELFLRLREVQS